MNSPYKVLMVDDSSDDAELVAMSLEQNGLPCHWQRVERRDELLKSLEEDNWQLVLCDVQMPLLNAEDVLELVRLHGRDIPVIILSGVVKESQALHLFSVGAKDFFSKDHLSRLPMAIHREIIGHRTHQTLLAREARFRAVTQSVSDAIIALDRDLKIILWNPGAELIFGYSEAEMLAQSIKQLFCTHCHDFVCEAQERLTNYTSSVKTNTSLELTGIRRDGSNFPLEITLSAWKEQHQIYYAAIIRDVTERKQLMLSLQETLQQAESASRAKSAFIANMSHEIRSPMNAILGMTDLVLDTELSEDQRDNLTIVHNSAGSLLKIINAILDLSKIEAGELIVESRPFALRDQVDKVCAQMALEAQHKGLELNCRVVPGIPPLMGDAVRLKQILINLIGNAIKFTDRGEVTVQVESVLPPRDPNRVELQISVCDSGIGIAPEDLGKLFDAFTQVDSATSRKYGGTGLGLTIVQQLVVLMHGNIGVDSCPGAGSTFFLNLDLDIATHPPAHQPASSASLITPLADQPVLLVDDNDTGRRIVAEMLTDQQAIVDQSTDLQSMSHYLLQRSKQPTPYRLAVLDFELLPTSLHNLQALRRKLSAVTHILLMTPVHHPKLAGLCDQGMPHIACIKKPLQRHNFYARIIKLLEGKEQKSSGALPPVAPPEVVPGRPLHILLVEDDQSDRQLAIKALQQGGHTTMAAGDGEEALTLLGREAFDLVLMDLQLPKLDGFATTEAIRRGKNMTADNQQIPIYALSGQVLDDAESRALAVGMNGFLAKPYSVTQLLQRVDEVARRKGGNRTHREALLTAPQNRGTNPILGHTIEDQLPLLLQELNQGLTAQSVARVMLALEGIKQLAMAMGARRVKSCAIRLLGVVEMKNWSRARTLAQNLEDELQQAQVALNTEKEEQS
uniref:Sensory/regulatory protein RpfC n=1 Tax=Magnetococcus massalia (strain MO-1) TaxID=451514 RepID=A0A1S7LG29_MAGMO|nr:putative hybrid histidine kinase with PAS fold and response regulator receiver domain [Candidatus Magnetococcus massalia]